MAPNAVITGWGMYAPSRILTNDDLSRMVDTSDEWIVSRTGIRERRIAGDDETTTSLSVNAARDALMVAGLDPAELDLVIVATVTPDRPMPSAAAFVHEVRPSRIPFTRGSAPSIQTCPSRGMGTSGRVALPPLE